jgi:hypothetical protein
MTAQDSRTPPSLCGRGLTRSVHSLPLLFLRCRQSCPKTHAAASDRRCSSTIFFFRRLALCVTCRERQAQERAHLLCAAWRAACCATLTPPVLWDMIQLLCLDTWTSRSIAQRQEAKRKDGYDVEDARDPEFLAQSARCVSAARLRGARRSTHVRAALVPGWYLKMPV